MMKGMGQPGRKAAGEKGVYLLLFRLRRVVRGPGSHRFPPGLYAYAGSARGGGGLAARLRRHFNLVRSKTARWNIDRLTLSRGYRPLGAIVWPGPREGECRLVRRLQKTAGVRPAAPRFGNHDDRAKIARRGPRRRPCAAHAWIFRGPVRPAALADALGGAWHPLDFWRRPAGAP